MSQFAISSCYYDIDGVIWSHPVDKMQDTDNHLENKKAIPKLVSCF
jgi:hypothetical protein